MKRIARKTNSGTPKQRTWRIVLIRNRGEFLGYVDAAEVESAEATAVRTFNLTAQQAKRLLIQERL